MKNNINLFIDQHYKFEEFISKNIEDYDDLKNYYDNAKNDAIFFHDRIKSYFKEDIKILEVGGGIHLLTNYLKQYHDITSIEPGNYSDGFATNIDKLRNHILEYDNKNIHTTSLENFNTTEKYDFIFSMNVLEHTININEHISKCLSLLKNKHSILFIECPNYSFPYEPHFREFFLPLFPKLTFKTLKKKKLIKKYGVKKYNNILNNINFDCKFNNIKKIKTVKFLNPLQYIFTRIENDKIFKKRILSNLFIKFIYDLITVTHLDKLLIKIFPIRFCPYLILEIKKDI